MRLYLIRHAQTEWNVSGRAQGHTDILLDETGREQAAMLGRAFEGIALDQVLSSDLMRSAETARFVSEATGAPLRLDPLLRERSFGEWEGITFDEFHKRIAAMPAPNDPFGLNLKPPGGESRLEVWERMKGVARALPAGDENVAVVTHGGACALLLALLLHANLESARCFRFGNTSITELHRRPDGLYTLIRFNDCAHLGKSPSLSGNIDGTLR